MFNGQQAHFCSKCGRELEVYIAFGPIDQDTGKLMCENRARCPMHWSFLGFESSHDNISLLYEEIIKA